MLMPTDVEKYLDQFRAFLGPPQAFRNDEWNVFSSHFHMVTAKRKELITTQGNLERYMYFVAEGVQRVFYSDVEGREATLVFTYAPSIGGVVDSMLLEMPSRFSYECLTPSVLLRAPYREIAELRKTMPALDEMFQIGLANAMRGVLERLAEVQCFSSEERFRSLLKRSPHILTTIPHKYLANYLGIDPTNFSKLINKVQI
jgi:signal-transduction protein with cAMP-binding, CBS, and nucleotidyltransferase domain